MPLLSILSGLSVRLRPGKPRALIPVILSVVLLSAAAAYAQGYGLSGLIQLTYRRDLLTSEGETTGEQWSIEQRYHLRYRGYIYHPRLLEFRLGGAFVKEDGKKDGGDLSAKGTDYDIRLDFLGGTDFPFSLFASKYTERSITPVTEGTEVIIEQRRRNIGLEGAVYSRRFPTFRYRAWEELRRVLGTASAADERTRNVSLGLSKSYTGFRASLDYLFVNRLDRTREETENTHDVNLNIFARLSPALRLTEYASYSTSSLDDFTEATSTTSLDYQPSRRFRANLSTYFSFIKQPDREGSFLTNYLNARYRISGSLTADATAMVLYNRGDFGNESAESASVSLSYGKTLARDTTVAADVSAGFGAEQREEDEDRTTHHARIGSRISHRFRAVKTSLTLGGSYYYYRTSLEGRTDRFDAVFRFFNDYVKRLTIQSEVLYINEKTLQDREASGQQREIIKDELHTDSSLTYSLPLGLRGTANFSSGLSTVSGTLERVYYYGEGSLMYILRRNLMTRLTARYSRETVESVDEIYGSAGVDYRFRMIFVRLSYEYFREKRKASDSERQSIFLQVSRPF